MCSSSQYRMVWYLVNVATSVCAQCKCDFTSIRLEIYACLTLMLATLKRAEAIRYDTSGRLISVLPFQFLCSCTPIPQVSIVGRQSPGPVLTPYTTSTGDRVLFLYMERLSMDVSRKRNW